VLHIFRTRASVSIGLRISPRSFVGAFTLLKRRLVRLEYCSCSSILVDAIIPMVLDKVLEAMRPHVENIVNDRLQPYIETIEHTKTTVLAQVTVIQQQNQTINNLTNKV
jgi:hypothetical protein